MRDNPYRSPTNRAYFVSVSSPLRWRIIPVCLGTLLGGLVLLYAAFVLVAGLIALYQQRDLHMAGPLLLVGFYTGSCGVAWMLGSLLCWHKHWYWSVSCFVCGLACLGLFFRALL